MIRPAKMGDAEAIGRLINYYAERGLMLHRSLESIYESLRDFTVCQQGRELIGCVALVLSWKDLGEIRSLAVAEDYRGKGVGGELLLGALDEARQLELKRVFALTYEPAFFQKFGFREVDKNTLPTKVWKDCIHCPQADHCQEVAVLIQLD